MTENTKSGRGTFRNMLHMLRDEALTDFRNLKQMYVGISTIHPIMSEMVKDRKNIRNLLRDESEKGYPRLKAVTLGLTTSLTAISEMARREKDLSYVLLSLGAGFLSYKVFQTIRKARQNDGAIYI
jgi:hypothetical protein